MILSRFLTLLAVSLFFNTAANASAMDEENPLRILARMAAKYWQDPDFQNQLRASGIIHGQGQPSVEETVTQKFNTQEDAPNTNGWGLFFVNTGESLLITVAFDLISAKLMGPQASGRQRAAHNTAFFIVQDKMKSALCYIPGYEATKLVLAAGIDGGIQLAHTHIILSWPVQGVLNLRVPQWVHTAEENATGAASRAQNTAVGITSNFEKAMDLASDFLRRIWSFFADLIPHPTSRA